MLFGVKPLNASCPAPYTPCMDPNDKSQAEDTLLVLEGMLAVQERREEFFLIVERALNLDEARRRVQEHFGFEDFVSHSVLELPVRRWTVDQRRILAAEAERIRQSRASEETPNSDRA